MRKSPQYPFWALNLIYCLRGECIHWTSNIWPRYTILLVCDDQLCAFLIWEYLHLSVRTWLDYTEWPCPRSINFSQPQLQKVEEIFRVLFLYWAEKFGGHQWKSMEEEFRSSWVGGHMVGKWRLFREETRMCWLLLPSDHWYMYCRLTYP